MDARWRSTGPALAVVVAIVAGVALTRGSGAGDRPPATTEPLPVEVSSDAPRVATLEELVAASDVVVRGEVSRTARGRLFGDPEGGSAIESRLVTLEVTSVLRGEAQVGNLLVEEEGWTTDGAPLVVDGAAPSAIGDEGIWFLTQVEGPEGPAYVTVSAQGRYVTDGDHLRGAAGDDPLIEALVTLSATQLAERIAALPG